MSDEIAQKIGRGGAGNFYTKADVENASVPPQKPSGSPRLDTQVESPTYARMGRGGVGNYFAPSQELPTSSSDARSGPLPAREILDTSKDIKEKISGDKSTAYRGHVGRGGAGNWRQGNDDAGRRKVEGEETIARRKIDESIRLDVEKGLKPPPKAFAAPKHAIGRG